MSSDGLAVVDPRNITIPTTFTGNSVETTPKCPWSNLSPTNQDNNVSLNDIMSEQLAGTLQVQEEQNLLKEILQEEPYSVNMATLEEISVSTDDCSSDQVIAQMLQMQFNKEFDEGLKRAEHKKNGNSKGMESLS